MSLYFSPLGTWKTVVSPSLPGLERSRECWRGRVRKKPCRSLSSFQHRWVGKKSQPVFCYSMGCARARTHTHTHTFSLEFCSKVCNSSKVCKLIFHPGHVTVNTPWQARRGQLTGRRKGPLLWRCDWWPCAALGTTVWTSNSSWKQIFPLQRVDILRGFIFK